MKNKSKVIRISANAHKLIKILAAKKGISIMYLIEALLKAKSIQQV